MTNLCAGDPAVRPSVTAGLVATAFQQIPLPRLRSVSQPAEKTLVNFDTIFYVHAQGFRRTVTLLGQRVELDIVPSRFVWHHGDGTSSSTSVPGAAYPNKDVTYRYLRADQTVRHSVTVTWTARYRVAGGPWADVPATVSVEGPSTSLRIAEAVPVLTSSH